MSKSLNPEREILKKELKNFEKSGSGYFDNEDYLACKTKFNKVYDKKVQGLRIKSKCDWYKKGEKSTKFFLKWKNDMPFKTKLKFYLLMTKF